MGVNETECTQCGEMFPWYRSDVPPNNKCALCTYKLTLNDYKKLSGITEVELGVPMKYITADEAYKLSKQRLIELQQKEKDAVFKQINEAVHNGSMCVDIDVSEFVDEESIWDLLNAYRYKLSRNDQYITVEWDNVDD